MSRAATPLTAAIVCLLAALLAWRLAETPVLLLSAAAVPALCELMGIPYTGSDAATLSIALDKALSKRVLRQHGILTPEFQLMAPGIAGNPMPALVAGTAVKAAVSAQKSCLK